MEVGIRLAEFVRTKSTSRLFALISGFFLLILSSLLWIYQARAADCSTTSSSTSGFVTVTIDVTAGCDWTIPTGVYVLDALVVGGGGGGGGGNSTQAGSGGGGGEVKVLTSKQVNPRETITVIVGAGGSGGSNPAGNGIDGSLSRITFSSSDSSTATGGKKGVSGELSGTNPAGGASGNGNAGGPSVDSTFDNAGGGGGSGAASTGRDGGSGTTWQGTAYGGGGGGGSFYTSRTSAGNAQGLGSSGGGGGGYIDTSDGELCGYPAGGEGGGGGGAPMYPCHGGAGASGVVKFRFAETATVTFDANGGTGSMANQIANTNRALSANSFSRTGYTFDGWSTTNNGSKNYVDGASYPFTSSQTLFARWSPNNLTVTYDSQGGSSISSGTTTTGSQISGSPGTPTRNSHTFRGWFTASSGGAAITFPYTHNQTANFTLYAQWTDNRQTQSISLGGGVLDKGTSTSVSAFGFSGTGAISYSLEGGACELNGSTLTSISGVGDCTVRATISGDDTYQSATTTAVYQQRTRLAQEITFAQPSDILLTSTGQSLTASANSGLAVTLSSTTSSICTLVGTTITPKARGNCTVVASQPGNSTYLPASEVSRTFKVIGLTQTIIFPKPDSMTTVSDDQKLSATSSAGLVVQYRSTTPLICDVLNGAVVPIAAGNCAIVASQPGDSTYEPAIEVSQTFPITFEPRSPQNLDLRGLNSMLLGDSPQKIDFTSNTKNPVSFAVGPANICKLDEQNKIVAIADGDCQITASQPQTRTHVAAKATASIKVYKDPAAADRAVGLDWRWPASITEGTPLGSNQLNATAKVPGTFKYEPDLGTVLPRGIQELKVTFIPDDLTKYQPTSTTAKILVSRGAVTPTPTPTPSASPTSSPRPTSSPIASPSPTSSPTSSIRPTPSPTSSPNVSPTASTRPSSSPSASASPSGSAKPSASASAKPSASASPSGTAKPSATASANASATAKPTQSSSTKPTSTSRPTPTPTKSASKSPKASQSATPSVKNTKAVEIVPQGKSGSGTNVDITNLKPGQKVRVTIRNKP